jgi:hypothetical protein
VSNSIRLTGDGRHVAYIAMDTTGFFACVDGACGRAYSSVTALRLSEDGTHHAYWASDQGEAFVVHDGREGRRYPLSNPGIASMTDASLQMSPDGTRAAYVALEESTPTLVVDNTEVGRYDDVTSLGFDAAARQFFHAFRRGGEVRLAHGTRVSRPYANVLSSLQPIGGGGAGIRAIMVRNDTAWAVQARP